MLPTFLPGLLVWTRIVAVLFLRTLQFGKQIAMLLNKDRSCCPVFVASDRWTIAQKRE